MLTFLLYFVIPVTLAIAGFIIIINRIIREYTVFNGVAGKVLKDLDKNHKQWQYDSYDGGFIRKDTTLGVCSSGVTRNAKPNSYWTSSSKIEVEFTEKQKTFYRFTKNWLENLRLSEDKKKKEEEVRKAYNDLLGLNKPEKPKVEEAQDQIPRKQAKKVKGLGEF